jgi:hypothetical protein
MSEMINHTYPISVTEQDLGEMGKSLSINEKDLIQALQAHIYDNMKDKLLPTKNGEEKNSYIEFKNGQGPAYRLDLHFTYVQERGQDAKVKIQGGDNRDYIIGTVNPNPQYNLDNPKDIKNSSGLPFDTSLLQIKRDTDDKVMPLIVSHPPKKNVIKDNFVKIRDGFAHNFRRFVATPFGLAWLYAKISKSSTSNQSILEENRNNATKREEIKVIGNNFGSCHGSGTLTTNQPQKQSTTSPGETDKKVARPEFSSNQRAPAKSDSGKKNA